jgi:hypothetical protein
MLLGFGLDITHPNPPNAAPVHARREWRSPTHPSLLRRSTFTKSPILILRRHPTPVSKLKSSQRAAQKHGLQSLVPLHVSLYPLAGSIALASSRNIIRHTSSASTLRLRLPGFPPFKVGSHSALVLSSFHPIFFPDASTSFLHAICWIARRQSLR